MKYISLTIFTIVTLLISSVVINSMGCHYSLTIHSHDGYTYDASCQTGRFTYINTSPNGSRSKTEGIAFALNSQVFHYVTSRKTLNKAVTKEGNIDNALTLYDEQMSTSPFFVYGFRRLSTSKVAIFESPTNNIYVAQIDGYISTLDKLSK